MLCGSPAALPPCLFWRGPCGLLQPARGRPQYCRSFLISFGQSHPHAMSRACGWGEWASRAHLRKTPGEIKTAGRKPTRPPDQRPVCNGQKASRPGRNFCARLHMLQGICAPGTHEPFGSASGGICAKPPTADTRGTCQACNVCAQSCAMQSPDKSGLGELERLHVPRVFRGAGPWICGLAMAGAAFFFASTNPQSHIPYAYMGAGIGR